ncbi:hypothetical protein CSUB01_05964 [Colletotrichum sublineola]|uniref:Uncharacterized protein n=1 Tax=Colletotrichum sublineola TaxID=1173701 RepID=A0A066WVU0_COLSU|nr:hypothetical protein CSUB01_05964 [Colletotrichum sublineola]
MSGTFIDDTSTVFSAIQDARLQLDTIQKYFEVYKEKLNTDDEKDQDNSLNGQVDEFHNPKDNDGSAKGNDTTPLYTFTCPRGKCAREKGFTTKKNLQRHFRQRKPTSYFIEQVDVTRRKRDCQEAGMPGPKRARHEQPQMTMNHYPDSQHISNGSNESNNLDSTKADTSSCLGVPLPMPIDLSIPQPAAERAEFDPGFNVFTLGNNMVVNAPIFDIVNIPGWPVE